MRSDLSVAVIGAGVGGLSTALALAQRGVAVAVYERRRNPENLGAGLVLWPNACHILDRLGLLDALRPHTGRLDLMVRYTSLGERLGHIDLTQISGEMGYENRPITRAKLQSVLSQAVRDLGVPVHYGHNLAQINGDGAVFDDGSRVSADVYVGADGRMDSVCRRFVAGESRPIYQGYMNWVGRLDQAKTAVFPVDQVGDFWGRGARFGLVPLGPGRAYWAGCLALPEDFVPPQTDLHTLLDAFCHWPDPIRAVIAETEVQQIRRIPVYDHDPRRGWHRDAVVLLGDAAHAALPTSGQGACQALEDAWHLADCLSQYDDLDHALSSYETLRFEKTTAITQARSLFDPDEARCRVRDQRARDADGTAIGQAMAGFWSRGLPM